MPPTTGFSVSGASSTAALKSLISTSVLISVGVFLLTVLSVFELVMPLSSPALGCVMLPGPSKSPVGDLLFAPAGILSVLVLSLS